MAETRLRQAIVELEQRGHCTIIWEREDGRVCLEGAIGAAYGDTELLLDGLWNGLEKNVRLDVEAATAVIVDQFPERLGLAFCDAEIIYTFNDWSTLHGTERTTLEDCKFVLEKAAINRESAVE